MVNIIKSVGEILLESFLFDYDGTLGKTLERQFLWFPKWAEMNKIPWKKISFKEFTQRYNAAIERGDFMEAYKEFGLPCDLEEKPCRVWIEYNNFKINNPAQLYEGVPELITKIHASFSIPKYMNKRIRMGINTTNHWSSIEQELSMYGLLDFFDSKISAEDLGLYSDDGVGKPLNKPNKISLDLSLNTLGANGFRTLFMGDTINDLRAGKSIPRNGNAFDTESLIMIGFAGGYAGRKKLEEGFNTGKKTYHYDYIVDNHIETLKVLDDIRG